MLKKTIQTHSNKCNSFSSFSLCCDKVIKQVLFFLFLDGWHSCTHWVHLCAAYTTLFNPSMELVIVKTLPVVYQCMARHNIPKHTPTSGSRRKMIHDSMNVPLFTTTPFIPRSTVWLFCLFVSLIINVRQMHDGRWVSATTMNLQRAVPLATCLRKGCKRGGALQWCKYAVGASPRPS